MKRKGPSRRLHFTERDFWTRRSWETETTLTNDPCAWLLVCSLGNRSRRGRYYPNWSHGQDNPKNDIEEQASAGAKHCQQPHYTDDCRIKVKIVGEAGAHTGNLLVGARTHQFPLAACRRREA